MVPLLFVMEPGVVAKSMRSALSVNIGTMDESMAMFFETAIVPPTWWFSMTRSFVAVTASRSAWVSPRESTVFVPRSISAPREARVTVEPLTTLPARFISLEERETFPAVWTPATPSTVAMFSGLPDDTAMFPAGEPADRLVMLLPLFCSVTSPAPAVCRARLVTARLPAKAWVMLPTETRCRVSLLVVFLVMLLLMLIL